MTEVEGIVSQQDVVLKAEYGLQETAPFNFYDSLKIQPTYEYKPMGIDAFIDMYEKVDELEHYLDVGPGELKKCMDE